jgi:hypothetical protein
MKSNELPANILAKVTEWLGAPSILHFWKFDETYVVLARRMEVGAGSIYCLRIFPVGDSLQLSQDNILFDL